MLLDLRRLLLVGTCWTVSTAPLWADGGTLRLSRQQGNLHIAVFTSPTPVRVGLVDVSVLVRNAATKEILLDGPVEVRTWSVNDPNHVVSAPATTAAATNKLLRAATLELTSPGPWQVQVSVAGPDGGQLLVDFDLEVGEPIPPWFELSLWIGWPIAAVALFIVHLILAHRRACRGD